VSDLINCGVYIFTPNIFSAIEDVLKQKKDRGIVGCYTMDSSIGNACLKQVDE
jgi:NDP-sugar pyrophosphorylase family protein